MLTKKAAVGRTPRIVTLPAQKMAVVYTRGDPNKVGPSAVPALYGAVYALKYALKQQGREFKVEPLRARWPNAQGPAKDDWVGIWGLPIPADTEELPQKVPGVEVKIETWAYGPVAEVRHIGQFSAEGPTIAQLLEFIAAQGYRPAGMHEEEYLSSVTAATQKTVIRYPVQPLFDPVAEHRELVGTRGSGVA